MKRWGNVPSDREKDAGQPGGCLRTLQTQVSTMGSCSQYFPQFRTPESLY
jgi:hypothetical protein